jgi:acyl-CoA thioesterase
MLNQDFFSQWMEIKLVEVREHYCLIEMPIKKEMINGLKTVHGGVTFAFADSALAFSSNNMGDAAVASIGRLDFYQILLVLLFEGAACFYVARRR